MKRKKLILGFFAVALLAGLVAWTRSTGNNDLSKVNISFERFETNSGQRMAVLCITNGSSYRVITPGAAPYFLYWDFPSGESVEFGAFCSGSGLMNAPTPAFDWTMFKLPKIASIGPGEVFRWQMPEKIASRQSAPAVWHIEAHLSTVSFRDKLPPALRACLSRSKADEPIQFMIKSPKVLAPTIPDKPNPAG